MSRVEKYGERYSMAFGVDHMPAIGVFVQVWDHSKYDMPDVDNIVEDHDRMSNGGQDVTPTFVLALAKKYEIPLDPLEILGVLHD